MIPTVGFNVRPRLSPDRALDAESHQRECDDEGICMEAAWYLITAHDDR